MDLPFREAVKIEKIKFFTIFMGVGGFEVIFTLIILCLEAS